RSGRAADDRRALLRLQESLEPIRLRAAEVEEAADLQEAPRALDLVLGDRTRQCVRIRRGLDRAGVAERLGADEGEEAEGRLHASKGETDRVDRQFHAAERHAALPSGARLRRRVELRQVREMARGQLWVRACEHARATCLE